MRRSAEEILEIQAVAVFYGFLIDGREWDRFAEVPRPTSTLVNQVIEDVSPDEGAGRSKAPLPPPGGSVAE